MPTGAGEIFWALENSERDTGGAIDQDIVTAAFDGAPPGFQTWKALSRSVTEKLKNRILSRLIAAGHAPETHALLLSRLIYWYRVD